MQLNSLKKLSKTSVESREKSLDRFIDEICSIVVTLKCGIVFQFNTLKNSLLLNITFLHCPSIKQLLFLSCGPCVVIKILSTGLVTQDRRQK